jgi:hypothetical protein
VRRVSTLCRIIHTKFNYKTQYGRQKRRKPHGRRQAEKNRRTNAPFFSSPAVRFLRRFALPTIESFVRHKASYNSPLSLPTGRLLTQKNKPTNRPFRYKICEKKAKFLYPKVSSPTEFPPKVSPRTPHPWHLPHL